MSDENTVYTKKQLREQRLREALLIKNQYSKEEASRLKYVESIPVSGYTFNKSGEIIVRSRRKFDLDKNAKAKIRYQIYRDMGYSPEEARKFRYQAYIDISGTRLDKTTGKIIKKDTYRKVVNASMVDEIITRKRRVENPTTKSLHGYLLSSKNHKGEYNKAVQYIKQRDNLSDSEAYYFAFFMLETGYSYERTRTELVTNRNFEINVSPKQKKILEARRAKLMAEAKAIEEAKKQKKKKQKKKKSRK